MFDTKRRVALFAPIAAIALLLAVAVIMLVGRMTPLVAAERALVNLGGDMAYRLENTPFGAFPMLIEAMEDGVVTVNFDFSDRWTEGSFSFELHSDEANREYMMYLSFDVDGFAFDAELHMDRHRIAVASDLLGDEFIGFTYATFREDFRPVAQMLGLSDDEADEIADIVDFIHDSMNMPEVGMEVFEPYAALFRQFMLDGTLSSESTTLVTRGQEVAVTRAIFHFTNADLVWLLRDLMTTMSQDRNLDPMGMIDPWMWDDIFRDLDFLLYELDEIDGDVYLTMYIGPQNRLMILQVDAYMNGDGASVNFGMNADFGTSVFDTWYFTFFGTTESPSWHDATMINSSYFELLMVWTFEESAGRFVNTIEITATSEEYWWDGFDETMHNWGSSDTGRLVSDWNSNTGAFVLSFEDDDPWGVSAEARGSFVLDSRGGFQLSFDTIDTGDMTFSISVSAEIGANIQPVQDFINFSDIPLSMLLELLF